MEEFRPKLFDSLKTYTKAKFMADLMAGIVVAVVVALPLAINCKCRLYRGCEYWVA